MNFVVIRMSISMFHGVPWNLVAFDLATPEFHEIHGIFHGILWNSCATKSNTTEFHGLPWNFEIVILFYIGSLGLPCNIPRNSMHLFCLQSKYHQAPWNPMELDDMQFGDAIVPWNSMDYFMAFHGTRVPSNHISPSSMDFRGIFHGIYSMEFNGIVVPPNHISPRSMEFHGTLRLLFYLIQGSPWLLWNIPWNSVESFCHQNKHHHVPWISMEFGDSRFGKAI